MDKQSISFGVGERTKRIVRGEVVEGTDEYTGQKDFYETAVRNHAIYLLKKAKGGNQARELIHLLNDIHGIEQPVPEDDAKIRIRNENVENNAASRIELAPELLDVLDRLKRGTTQSRAEIIRRCVFGELNTVVHETELLSGWREREIRTSWQEAQLGLERPKNELAEVLERLFVDEYTITKERINEDQSRFNDFAEEYVDQFYDSELYAELVEENSGRAFSDVETAILDHADEDIASDLEDEQFERRLRRVE